MHSNINRIKNCSIFIVSIIILLRCARSDAGLLAFKVQNLFALKQALFAPRIVPIRQQAGIIPNNNILNTGQIGTSFSQNRPITSGVVVSRPANVTTPRPAITIQQFFQGQYSPEILLATLGAFGQLGRPPGTLVPGNVPLSGPIIFPGNPVGIQPNVQQVRPQIG